jgi:hypothetical protein
MPRLILASLLAGAWVGCYQSTPFDDEDDDVAGGDVAPPGDVPPDVTEEAPPFCGDEKEPRATPSPIVDGQESFDPSVVELTEGQVLAVGAMLQRSPWGGGWQNACTATLVADTVVLTAAHCVRSWGGTVRASDVRFAVGRDCADPLHTYDVAEVHADPDYRGGGGEDAARADQAVLLLPEPAQAALPEIEPIPINREDFPEDYQDSLVQNAGFGTTSPRGGENSLLWWTTEVVDSITEYDFVVYGGGVSSVCFGDSGGPSLWTYPDGVVRVGGTVSWGDPSCVDYDHFARTDYNLEFLLPYVGEEPVDPCGGLTWEGRCEGDVAVWCIDGATYRRDCAACFQTCGDAGPSLGYYCI